MLTTLGWIGLLILTAWCALTAGRTSGRTTVGWYWWALCAAVLLCFRRELIQAPFEFNPDEAHLIAGAITLRHDPVFWRSVDGITAGPLDFYPLLPTASATGLTSFTIERLIGLFVNLGIWLFAGETVAIMAGNTIARAAVLPALAFSCLTRSPDFLFYSTELVPLLLISAALYFLTRQYRVPRLANLWFASLLAGAAPWAKLQAIPITAVVLALAILSEITRRKSISRLSVGCASKVHDRAAEAQSPVFTVLVVALIPSLGFALMASVTGQIHHMVISYWLNNFGFVQASQLTIVETAKAKWSNAVADGYLALWIVGTATLVFGGLVQSHQSCRSSRRWLFSAVAVCTACLVAIILPRRDTVHHLYFIELPLILMTGASLASLQFRAWTASSVWIGVAVGLLPQLAWAPRHRGAVFETNPANISPERVQLAQAVASHANKGEPVAVWGWRSALYVDTGTIQATREGQTQPQLNPGAWRPYFLKRYLNDFRRSDPVVFVDAVGPGNYLSTPGSTHESFRELAELVRSKYTLSEELDNTRVYVRNDRLSVPSVKRPIR